MSKNIKKACPFTDEIVSYMYGEIGGQAELEFETHLADCMICTDEFAEASNARFSVYEWKKEAFDPLPTPGISVPYGEATAVESYLGGLLAGIRAWAASLSMPVTVAAGLAVCIGLGLVIFAYLGRSEQQVASNRIVPVVEAPEPVVPNAIREPDEKQGPQPMPIVSTTRPERTVRGVKHAPKSVDRPSFAVDRDRAPQIRKAPALEAYQDTEDESLRLADLFDEVGG